MVLVAGGGTYISSAELFNPATGTWTTRFEHSEFNSCWFGMAPAALAEFRRLGWKLVIAAGESRGAWTALQMLDSPGLADVVIAGYGPAGAAAAIAAHDAGRSVLILESAERGGGNARYSGGFLFDVPGDAAVVRLDIGSDRP